MTEIHDRVCTTCGAGGEAGHLEACSICQRHFCVAAAQGILAQVCSADWAPLYYFTGETDDDEDLNRTESAAPALTNRLEDCAGANPSAPSCARRSCGRKT